MCTARISGCKNPDEMKIYCGNTHEIHRDDKINEFLPSRLLKRPLRLVPAYSYNPEIQEIICCSSCGDQVWEKWHHLVNMGFAHWTNISLK